jgi:hypothetical protein
MKTPEQVPWPPPRRRLRGFERWQPWRPRGLRVADPTKLSYIVVDEIVKPTCVLAVSEWPRLDKDGRVRFRLDRRPHLVRVAVRELEKFLAKNRSDKTLRDRAVRIGDVFAARADTAQLAPPESEEEAQKLEHQVTGLQWLKPPVYDISLPAREAAKAALYGAVTPVLSEGELKRLGKRR